MANLTDTIAKRVQGMKVILDDNTISDKSKAIRLLDLNTLLTDDLMIHIEDSIKNQERVHSDRRRDDRDEEDDRRNDGGRGWSDRGGRDDRRGDRGRGDRGRGSYPRR